ncbi:MAG: 4-hydroxyphenylacetate 3-hydroxylase [Acidimicrobiia bacterium]|nr:4-hydroxyphenylacetate 3-hydroxylase [Acidimicrobiia bacterium]
MTRTGSQYRQGLNDGRTIFINGERVGDVGSHRAFSRAVDSIAALYDLTNEPATRKHVTYPSPSTGEPVNVAYMIPRSREDLRHRREGLRVWSESTFGLMGRSPDHVAGFLAGFAAAPELFEEVNKEHADNLLKFYEWARDEDQYLTYVIVPPQIDRSKPAHKQQDPHLYAGVKEERDDGIVVAGAQMLGTAAAISDWILLSCIVPLGEGDERYANTMVVPLDSPGLKIYARRSYADAATSVFDYPLASNYDESDALVVFDEVFVPWENVFVYQSLELVRDQWWKTPSHVLGNSQAQIRLWTKLDFLVGIAKAVAEMNGSLKAPPVQSMLGELASYATQVRSLVLAQEANAKVDENGVYWPGVEEVHACSAIQIELYPRMVGMIRELCGGGLIQLPSSRDDFLNPEASADIERYIQSPGYPSRERVKLLKLAWDILGSEFAGRQLQYELFYAGAPHLVKSRVFNNYDFARSDALLDEALTRYDLDT